MRQRILSLFLVYTLVAVMLPSSSFAKEQFDPNYIISDSEMTNWHAMDQADVQRFLEDQKGTLDTTSIPDIDGVQKLASRVIYDAARRNRINPRVLLVMLQKEQSLLSDTSPTLKQMNWATGYALCDSCSSGDPLIQKHKGFATQVDSAAGLMRYYYDNLGSQKWIKRSGESYNIDGVEVEPATDATGFLYTYTPHIEGNLNFWKLWKEWFERSYPDGLLVKSAKSPEIWYLEKGMRRHIASMNVFNSYFRSDDILLIDSMDITEIPQGTDLKYANYSLLRSNNRTYLLADGKLNQFASDEAIRALGFNPLEIIDATDSELSEYKKGRFITSASAYPLGALLKSRKSQKVYKVQNGYKYPLLDNALLKTNFSGENPLVVNDEALIDYIEGAAITFIDGSLVGAKGDPKIYFISNGARRHIASESVFIGLGFDWDDVVFTSKELLELHKEGPPINFDSENTQIASQ